MTPASGFIPQRAAHRGKKKRVNTAKDWSGKTLSDNCTFAFTSELTEGEEQPPEHGHTPQWPRTTQPRTPAHPAKSKHHHLVHKQNCFLVACEVNRTPNPLTNNVLNPC